MYKLYIIMYYNNMPIYELYSIIIKRDQKKKKNTT